MGAGHITASRGFYNNGGTVAPGNSIGTLTITGDYTHAAAAVLETEVGGGASDLLAVTGTADIQGGTLTIVPYGYATAGDYTFLTAGTLLGAFDQTDTPAVLNAAVSSPTPNVLSMSITPVIGSRRRRAGWRNRPTQSHWRRVGIRPPWAVSWICSALRLSATVPLSSIRLTR